MNQSGDDAFLKDLQGQCLKDSAEHISEIRSALLDLGTNVKTALNRMMKSAHCLKGNFQAVGFLSLSHYIHEFESAIHGVDERCDKCPLSSEDAPVLEFFISDAITAIENYVAEIVSGATDTNELAEKRKVPLKVLSEWVPSSLVVSAPPVQPTPGVIDEKKTVVPPESSAGNKIENAHEEVVVAIKEHSLAKDNRYLICKRSSSTYAVPVNSVVEVVQNYRWNKLPKLHKHVLGLMNLRGEIIPIVDLFSSNTQKSNDVDRKFIVICRQETMQFGFAVDFAEQVSEFSPEHFEPVGAVNVGKFANFITHFILQESETIFVVDVAAPLSA